MKESEKKERYSHPLELSGGVLAERESLLSG